jgi:hypothetical protein
MEDLRSSDLPRMRLKLQRGVQRRLRREGPTKRRDHRRSLNDIGTAFSRGIALYALGSYCRGHINVPQAAGMPKRGLPRGRRGRQPLEVLGSRCVCAVDATATGGEQWRTRPDDTRMYSINDFAQDTSFDQALMRTQSRKKIRRQLLED